MKNIKIFMFLIGALIFCQSMFAQDSGNMMIRGKMVSENKEELVSATVLEVDATGRVMSNALTDMNGEFSMKIVSARNRLRFSYVGFIMQELPIGNNRDFQIVMKENNTTLTEVTVTAKRKVSKGGLEIPADEVSNATQRLNTDVFIGMQIPSIDDALQGQIAGLDIIGSGNVGMSAQMRIRGISSLNANSNPLIVINGIMRPDIATSEFDFSGASDQQFADLLMLNPEDIQEITVLKDAASTAIYGSRGASGVLEIKTKRGARGSTRVSYTYKYLSSQQPQGMKMLNGDNYTMLMKQAYFNPSQDPNASAINEFTYDPTWSEYKYYNNNTDWRKAVIQRGITSDHNFVISGGGDRALFRVTGGYMTKSGSIIGQNWDRYTSRSTLDYYVSSRITFTSELAFTYSDNDYNWMDGRSGNGKSILEIAYKKMPNMSIYNKDENGQNLPTYYTMLQSSQLFGGDQGSLRNPVALARLATNNNKAYNVDPVFRLSYDLIDRGEKGRRMLKYEGYVSFNMDNNKTHKFLPKEVSPLNWTSEDINRVDDSDSESFGIQSENKLTYKPDLGESHSLQMLVALQTFSATLNGEGVLAYGFPSSQITTPYAAAYVRQVGSSIGQGRSMGMNAQVHYAYRSKYVGDITFRREGSTKFGKNNKFGDFPAVSMRWNISDEPFMKRANKWLSMLSLRPSWGVSGDAPANEYMHFSTYSPWSSYAGTSTIRPDNIRLSNLRWAKTNEFNLGTDIEMWDGKFTMDANVYHRTTTDMLLPNVPIPGSTGFDNLLYRNSGSMRNIGWELNMHGNRFLQSGDFSFDAYFNLANSVNTLLTMDQDFLDSYNQPFDYTNRSASYINKLEPNHPYGSIYGFRYKGVYQYSIDNPALIESNYTLGTAPIARNAKGEIIHDSNGNPLPMYYSYGTQGMNYQFTGGDAIYEDVNHDGQIDANDIVYLGNCNPKLNGGFGLIMRWKTLSCNAYFTFRYGNKVINAARRDAESMLSDFNQSIATDYRWRREGDITVMPRALHGYGWNSLPSDRYVEDGSFLRFKTLTFNYTVPNEWLRKYYVKQLTLSLNFTNLLCFTKYQGVDPEIIYDAWGISNDNSITPRSKDFTLGLAIGF